MTGSSVAGIITAIASGITAIALLAAAMPALIKVLRRTKETQQAVAEVHVLVNQNATDASNFNQALIRELIRHGIEVPVDQSRGAVPVADTPPHGRSA